MDMDTGKELLSTRSPKKPPQTVSQPAKNQNETMEMEAHILKLNMDCFLEIFRHLSVQDMAHMKQVYKSCVSLGDAADWHFTKKTNGSLRFFDEYTFFKEIKIIKQFGAFIYDLEFAYQSLDNKKWSRLFSTLKTNCKNNLKSLNFSGKAAGNITKVDVKLIADVLKNIETLKMDHPGGSYVSSSVLSHCKNVKDVDVNFKIDKSRLRTLFQENKNLSKLRMRIKGADLKMISDKLTKTPLEQLSLHINITNDDDENVPLPKRMPTLKRLSIHGRCAISPSLSNRLQSLNSLCFSHVYLDETSVIALGSIELLTVLSLNYCSLPDLCNIKYLPFLCGNKNLEHFQYLFQPSFNDSFDEVNFLELIEKRKEAAAVKRLHLTFLPDTSCRIFHEIPLKLLEENENIIKIIDTNVHPYRFHHFW